MAKEERGHLWVGVAIFGLIALAFAVVFYALPGEDDDAARSVQAFLNTAKAGEPRGVYNGLHPSVHERVSFARCREIMRQHRELFRSAQVTRATPSVEPGAHDVEAQYVAAGVTHRVLVRQRLFNGMRRITDGEIEAPSTDQNLPLVTDILLDGRSILTSK
jgi:hypothetical protein